MNMRNKISYIAEHIAEVTVRDQEEIDELLEHDEWGIALETIYSVLIEENIMISKEIYDLIKEAAKAMKLDFSTWEDLSHLIR